MYSLEVDLAEAIHSSNGLVGSWVMVWVECDWLSIDKFEKYSSSG
jgi:hypothetical protein